MTPTALHRTWLELALLGAAVLCTSRSAAQAPSRADTESCLEAHVEGQRLLTEGKLHDAVAQFARCSGKVCPKVVRRDCARLSEETKAKLGSVRLDVADHRGMPVEDATIVIDGKATETRTGDLIELDPGKHWARVIGKAGRSVEVTFDVAPGQRDLRVAARLPAPEAKPRPAPANAADRVPAATWVSGAVAIVGLSGFALFALSGSGKQSDLDACKPSCSDRSVYRDMKRDYLIADVSLGIAVLAGGAGAYFYLTRPSSRAEPAAGWIRARGDRGAGGLELGASF